MKDVLSSASQQGPVGNNTFPATVPPPGCWLLDHGSHQVIGATTRMRGAEVTAVVVFSAVWNLFTAYFIARSLARTVYAMGGAPPSWLPQPTVTAAGVDGALVFIWFVCSVFAVAGLGWAYLALLGLFGRVEVTVRGGEASVFTGVGPVGLRKRFDVHAVKSVTIGRTRWEPDDEHLPEIVVEADREVRLGSMLSPPRMNWMAAVLTETLVRR